jgi:hypothetical protein
MELAIAAGVALLGYGMAGKGPRDPPARAPAMTAEYTADENDTRVFDRRHAELAAERWRASRDPALTGIVSPATRLTNAPLPFFRSARKQNTNDGVKQTLLERFTGATAMDSSVTGTWKRKREVEAMFAPRGSGPVGSSGTVGNPMYSREGRYEASRTQNNVLPAEQIRVGRGVGVGPDVAATDGFHPMYRVIPKNVGEYKKNNLPGRTNHGFSRIQARTEAPKISMNHNPGSLVYDQNRRPMQESRAAVLAPAVYGALSQDPGMRPRPMDIDRFGNPAAAGPGGRAGADTRYGCGDDPDRNHGLPALNVTGAGAGVGAFTAAAFDPARFRAQHRETAGREGFVAGPTARRVPSGHLLPPTQRDMTAPAPGGGVGIVRSSGAARPFDAAKHTLRETQNGAAITGVSAAVHGGMLDNVWRYKRLDRESKRGAQLLEHTPGPGRTNLPTGRLGRTVTTRAGASAPAPAAPNVPNKAHNARLGARAVWSNKLPSTNQRLDLGLAAAQLAGNPYAQPPLWAQ